MSSGLTTLVCPVGLIGGGHLNVDGAAKSNHLPLEVVALVLLAAIPAALVLADRLKGWLGLRSVNKRLRVSRSEETSYTQKRGLEPRVEIGRCTECALLLHAGYGFYTSTKSSHSGQSSTLDPKANYGLDESSYCSRVTLNRAVIQKGTLVRHEQRRPPR